MIAAQRRRVREKEVGDQHRLRPPQVRVRRHDRIARGHRLIAEHLNQRFDRLLQQRHAALEIQPQIQRHLLVARAAGVQPPAGLADSRHQLPLDERVHVLVVFRGVGIEEGRIRASGENLIERALDRGDFRRRQHARRVNRFSPRHAARHVVFEEPAIEPERCAEREQGGVRSALESTRPEMRHQTACGSGAMRPLGTCQFGDLRPTMRQSPLKSFSLTEPVTRGWTAATKASMVSRVCENQSPL